jgi:hypothetical protein
MVSEMKIELRAFVTCAESVWLCPGVSGFKTGATAETVTEIGGKSEIAAVPCLVASTELVTVAVTGAPTSLAIDCGAV